MGCQLLLPQLVEWFRTDVGPFVDHLATEADLDDLPPAPAPQAPADDSDLVEMIISEGVQ